MSLADTYVELRAALMSLGIDVGSEVLDVWRDRERHGYGRVAPGNRTPGLPQNRA